MPGWFKETSELATAVLISLGCTVKAPFELYQVCPYTAILRVETKKGYVHLDASDNKEGKVTQCIADLASYLVRKPLHVNLEKEWMLMEDYGTTLSDRSTRGDVEFMQILRGKLQLECIQHVQKLMKAGVPRVSADSSTERTEKMRKDPRLHRSFVKFKEFAAVDDSGLQDLRKYGQVTCAFLQLISSTKVPLTLCHGNLADNNIIEPDANERN